mgnify:CR=1 FL=1
MPDRIHPDQIRRAAAAIANARGNRRGVPSIVNILDILPAKLLDEVMEDARVALEAAAPPGPAKEGERSP